MIREPSLAQVNRKFLIRGRLRETRSVYFGCRARSRFYIEVNVSICSLRAL